MNTAEPLIDAFARIRQIVHRNLDGLDPAWLATRPAADANPLGWLIWHATRVQDNHMAELAGRDEEWQTGAWSERFGLPGGYVDTGFGHTSAQVDELAGATAEALGAYHDAVNQQTTEWLSQIHADDLDRIVDESWDPPVTAGVRVVSVIADGLQHVGQASYVRGLLERRR